jgi:Protein of unknown function DUF262/Protein of unknown function (DUF1524)
MNSTQSIASLFTNRVLQVPDYQRGYAWEYQQREEFLDDLEFLGDKKVHYTGTVIFHKQPNAARDAGLNTFEVFDVVDGQQRLTTIVILLDCVRAEIARFNKIAAESIKERFISYLDDNAQTAFRLRLNRDCRAFFEQSVIGIQPSPQGVTIASHQRLLDAKTEFTDYLEKNKVAEGKQYSAWLTRFYDKITNQLVVLNYSVDQASDVGVIFEVTNNRGKQLSELEKVKNYLLYIAGKLELEAHGLADEVNKAWTTIFEKLMAHDLTTADDEDRLLRSHWLVAYDPTPKNWKGSKSVKARFSLKTYHGRHQELLSDLQLYTQSLQNALIAFCEANRPRHTNAFGVFPSSERAKVRQYAEKLPRLRVIAPFLPLLMACRLKFPTNGQRYLDLLQLCELYAFRVYRWEGKRSNAGQTTLFRLGHQLYTGAISFPQVLRELRGTIHRYCSNRTFKDGFVPDPEDNIWWYGWAGLKYFLYEYEEHLAGKKVVQLPWEALEKEDPAKSIEHIYPQSPKDSYWTTRFDKAARKLCSHDIGNLCITADNSSYGNRPFPDKKGEPGAKQPCYANSNLFVERELAAYREWTPAAVLKRRKRIVAWALQRWHLDESDLVEGNIEEDGDEELPLE